MPKDAMKKEALEYHRSPTPGKICVKPTKPCLTQRDLALAYSPGVAEPCLPIADNPRPHHDRSSSLPRQECVEHFGVFSPSHRCLKIAVVL